MLPRAVLGQDHPDTLASADNLTADFLAFAAAVAVCDESAAITQLRWRINR